MMLNPLYKLYKLYDAPSLIRKTLVITLDLHLLLLGETPEEAIYNNRSVNVPPCAYWKIIPLTDKPAYENGLLHAMTSFEPYGLAITVVSRDDWSIQITSHNTVERVKSYLRVLDIIEWVNPLNN